MSAREQVAASLEVIAAHLDLAPDINADEREMIEVELNKVFNAGAAEATAGLETLEAELADLEEKVEQARADRWEAMSDAERDAEIKGACA